MPHPRALQKVKQVRRLKLEEVKVLAQEGIELNAAEYQLQVEQREAQRRQAREERLAKEAIMTLEAMEREEQEAAEAAARVAEAPAAEGEDDKSSWRLFVCLCAHSKNSTRLMRTLCLHNGIWITNY